jgi:hypothetical protein
LPACITPQKRLIALVGRAGEVQNLAIARETHIHNLSDPVLGMVVAMCFSHIAHAMDSTTRRGE